MPDKMTLTPEQISSIKKQLLEQIDSSFPADKKAQAKKQIQEMNENQLEEFLKQNNLIQDGEPQTPKCIFCSIVEGKIPSRKIAENEKAVAILNIKPITKGHITLVPKTHIEKPEDLPKEIQELATEISKKINQKLKSKSLEIKSQNILGHEVIHLIPIYNDEDKNIDLNKDYPPAEEKDLEELYKELAEETKPEVIEEKPKETKIYDEKNTWLPVRIP